MSNLVDVIVVGGGPAGAALTLRLARAGCQVVLLERTAYDSFRPGESLAPSAASALVQLGIWEPFLATNPEPAYGVLSAWGSGALESSSFLSHPQQQGWQLDRSRFDAMLSSSAQAAGARVVRQATARSVERSPEGGWLIKAGSKDGELELRARFLVDATGRAARVCRQLGNERERVDGLLGVCRIFACPKSEPMPLLIEAQPLGWWYSAALPGARCVATFFTDADICRERGFARSEAWSTLLAQSHHTQQRLAGRAPLSPAKVFNASSHCLSAAAGEGWLAVGDALVARDPLSSSGIDFALASAERAFVLLLRLARGESEAAQAFNAQVRRDFAVYLQRRHAYYALEGRWPQSPFWERRSMSSSESDSSSAPTREDSGKKMTTVVEHGFEL
jgi:flavin-dependent dehydrogenase